MNMTQTVVQAHHPPVTASSTALRRVVGAGVAVGAVSLLGVAAWLDPSPEGLGTHSQLSLPPCGWILTMDLPCPTCGMTTAFAHRVQNETSNEENEVLGCKNSYKKFF